MIYRPALGDVVQEGGEIKRGAVADLMEHLADQRMILLAAPASMSLSTPTVRSRCSSIGVVMIHRELHHPDDAAEIGNEPAKHAGLVHPAQRRLRRAARGQDFQEQPVGLGFSRNEASMRLSDWVTSRVASG